MIENKKRFKDIIDIFKERKAQENVKRKEENRKRKKQSKENEDGSP